MNSKWQLFNILILNNEHSTKENAFVISNQSHVKRIKKYIQQLSVIWS